MENNTFKLDLFTIICCVIIIAAFLIAWVYVATTSSTNFNKRKKWIDQLPSIISTLGVLGTFLGITKGLISFDTANLDKSIPLLLGGLKTAFLTSLSGMFGSLILNRVVSHKFDKESSESEEIKAANLIISELRNDKQELSNLLNNNNTDLVNVLKDNEIIKAIRQDVEQMKDDIEEIKGHVEEQKTNMSSINGYAEKIHNNTNSIITQISITKDAVDSSLDALSKVRAVLVTATASISTVDNNIDEIKNIIGEVTSDIFEISENLNEVRSTLEYTLPQPAPNSILEDDDEE